MATATSVNSPKFTPTTFPTSPMIGLTPLFVSR
jgi:hypothetical protein